MTFFHELPPRIALIGFMGCGKTSIGKRLASLSGRPFADLDAEIEGSCGLKIVDIFRDRGESSFRELEAETLTAITEDHADLVLSCGGGIVLSRSNRDFLRENYLTVWIDVPFDELMKRLAGERTDRPLLHSGDYAEKARALFLARRPLYEETASLHHRWSGGGTAEDEALAVLKGIGES